MEGLQNPPVYLMIFFILGDLIKMNFHVTVPELSATDLLMEASIGSFWVSYFLLVAKFLT